MKPLRAGSRQRAYLELLLIKGPRTLSQMAELVGTSERDALGQLQRLERRGLAAESHGWWAATFSVSEALRSEADAAVLAAAERWERAQAALEACCDPFLETGGLAAAHAAYAASEALAAAVRARRAAG